MFILVEGMVANADVRSDLNLLFGFNGKHINSKPIVFDSFIRLVSMMFVFGMMFFLDMRSYCLMHVIRGDDLVGIR